MRAPISFATLALLATTAAAQISLPQRILYRIDGPAASSWFAEPVQGGIGDMNRDGHDDFIAVRPHSTVFLYSGRTGEEIYQFSQSVGGFGQNGSVSPAGDVNNDGFMDLLVGATGGGANGEGRVWVVSGAYIFNKSGNEVLYTFDGETTGGENFTNPGRAGDVNRDGFDDILVGDELWDDTTGTDQGKVYLYSGKDGKLLYTRKGTQTGQYMGSSVYGCADVNKDGFPDLVIGSRGYDGTGGANQGRIEVISGLYIVTSAPPEVLYSRDGEFAGDSFCGWFNNVLEAGADIDKDTWPDIVVAAPGFDGPAGGNTGKAYVISGKYVHSRTGNEFVHQFVGSIAGIGLGTDVNIVEDVNNDGHDDIAASSSSSTGLVVVWSGKDGKELFRVGGESSSVQFGYRIDGAGDVNNDGYGDLLVGDWDWGTPRGVGRCYVISGKQLMLESYQSRHSISGSPTKQDFSLDAGAGHANKGYLLATSLGTGPISIGGVSVPLTPGPWFNEALPLILGGNPFFPKWLGQLDGSGKAATSWTLPASTNSALIGLSVFQAFVVHQNGQFFAASNAVPMTFVR